MLGPDFLTTLNPNHSTSTKVDISCFAQPIQRICQTTESTFSSESEPSTKTFSSKTGPTNVCCTTTVGLVRTTRITTETEPLRVRNKARRDNSCTFPRSTSRFSPTAGGADSVTVALVNFVTTETLFPNVSIHNTVISTALMRTNQTVVTSRMYGSLSLAQSNVPEHTIERPPQLRHSFVHTFTALSIGFKDPISSIGDETIATTPKTVKATITQLSSNFTSSNVLSSTSNSITTTTSSQRVSILITLLAPIHTTTTIVPSSVMASNSGEPFSTAAGPNASNLLSLQRSSTTSTSSAVLDPLSATFPPPPVNTDSASASLGISLSPTQSTAEPATTFEPSSVFMNTATLSTSPFSSTTPLTPPDHADNSKHLLFLLLSIILPIVFLVLTVTVLYATNRLRRRRRTHPNDPEKPSQILKISTTSLSDDGIYLGPPPSVAGPITARGRIEAELERRRRRHAEPPLEPVDEEDRTIRTLQDGRRVTMFAGTWRTVPEESVEILERRVRDMIERYKQGLNGN